jgi:hypothetical protein
MSSRFFLIAYYNTCYTSPFLNKNGSPLLCFHPVEHFDDKENQCIVEPPSMQVHEHLGDQPIVQNMDGSPPPHVDEI